MCFKLKKICCLTDHGGGQLDCMFALYSGILSLNPAGLQFILVNCCWKERKKHKDARVGPFKKNLCVPVFQLLIGTPGRVRYKQEALGPKPLNKIIEYM